MPGILKANDLLSRKIQTVAPVLARYYSEEKILELLEKGEGLAKAFDTEAEALRKALEVELQSKRQETEMALEGLREAAREEGLRQAKQEIEDQFTEFLNFVRESKENYEQAFNKIVQEAETEIVSFCIKIAEKVIKAEFVADPKIFGKYIAKVVKEITQQEKVLIRVHPDQYKILDDLRDQLKQELGMVKELAIEPSAAVTVGGVIFEMDSGFMDAQVETQLAHIKSSLLHG